MEQIYRPCGIWNFSSGTIVPSQGKSKVLLVVLVERLLTHTLPLVSSVILKKSLYNLVGGFNETLARIEDYDLWLRILRQNTTRRMGYFPRSLTVYDGACHGKYEQPKGSV